MSEMTRFLDFNEIPEGALPSLEDPRGAATRAQYDEYVHGILHDSPYPGNIALAERVGREMNAHGVLTTDASADPIGRALSHLWKDQSGAPLVRRMDTYPYKDAHDKDLPLQDSPGYLAFEARVREMAAVNKAGAPLFASTSPNATGLNALFASLFRTMADTTRDRVQQALHVCVFDEYLVTLARSRVDRAFRHPSDRICTMERVIEYTELAAKRLKRDICLLISAIPFGITHDEEMYRYHMHLPIQRHKQPPHPAYPHLAEDFPGAGARMPLGPEGIMATHNAEFIATEGLAIARYQAFVRELAAAAMRYATDSSEELTHGVGALRTETDAFIRENKGERFWNHREALNRGGVILASGR